MFLSARRLTLAILASLCAAFGVLALASAPALAAAPTIEGESSSEVASSGVRLSATVNPGRVPSEYFFEYGTSAAYGSKTAPTSIGAGAEGVRVFAQLGELQAETEYHFRVVAENANGESALGGDETFTTLGAFPPAPAGLPDDRGYELVTPYMENAEVFTTLSGTGPFEVALDGDAVSYKGEPSAGGNGTTGYGEGGNEYLATRVPGGGWTAQAIQPEHTIKPDEGGPAYVGFTSDLSEGFLSSGEPLLEGDEGGVYSRELPAGSYGLIAANAASAGSTPTTYAGSTPDGSHVLLEENAGGHSTMIGSGLYDSVEGRLAPVSVLPDGSQASGMMVFGGPGRNEGRGNGLPDFDHVISEDGSRIFWSTLELVSGELYKPSALYVREDDASADARTVQVDGVEPGCASCGPSGGGRFWMASSDGSRVYFTDESRLTADSTAASGEPDLYVYDVESEKLTDLSVDANPGEHANVLGVAGAGESAEGGAYVYFVADGELASGAVPATCGGGGIHEVDEVCNLYVVGEGEAPRFIAVLSPNDDATKNVYSFTGDWIPTLGGLTSEVTPDGRHLAFLHDGQLYVYDAVAGSLACASCAPAGGGSALVPISENATYQPRFISDDGEQVFFETQVQLTQRPGGGVYEWEQDGSGSCRLSPGCIYLLSHGVTDDPYSTGNGQSLIGASASGSDVFFETREQLVPQDGDEDVKLYDARVGAQQPLASLACTSSGCQGAPLPPPVFATPASVTFAGVGDFEPTPPATSVKSRKKAVKCAKGKKLSHGKCVKSKRKKKSKKAKKAGEERGANS